MVDAARDVTDAEVIVVHMDAINHCPLIRADLRAELDSVSVSADGERIELS